MRLHCWMESKIAETRGFWSRNITFPIAPFPGLRVGSHVVKRVFCCQGNLDDETLPSVQLKATDVPDDILLDQGWTWEE